MEINDITAGTRVQPQVQVNTQRQDSQSSSQNNMGGTSVKSAEVPSSAYVTVNSGASSVSQDENAEDVQVANENTVKNAVKHTNSKVRTLPHKKQFEFSYHEQTKRISIKIIDEETNEIVKEIPPEKTLDMVAKMWELAGILVDEKR